MDIKTLVDNLNGPAEAERLYSAEDLGALHEAAAVAALAGRLAVEPSRAVKEIATARCSASLSPNKAWMLALPTPASAETRPSDKPSSPSVEAIAAECARMRARDRSPRRRRPSVSAILIRL